MKKVSDFVLFVVDQMKDAGEITYKHMFGGYGIYCDGKFFAAIDDDQLFIKITKAGERFAPTCTKAPPYEGASDYFLIEDVENQEFLVGLARVTCEELPIPKPKKPKAQKAAKKSTTDR